LNEDDPKGLLKGLFGGWNRLRENVVGDIGLGFVPIAGTAADVQDAKRAIENRDLVGLGLAGVGFVPGVGDVVKAAGKGLRRAVSNLPMDQASRIARARELGFDVDNPVYHGTPKTFEEFKPSSHGLLGEGVYVSSNPEVANRYVGKYRPATDWSRAEVPQVIPMYTRATNLYPVKGGTYGLFDIVEERVPNAYEAWRAQEISTTEIQRLAQEILKDRGYQGMIFGNPGARHGQAALIFDPSDLRSVNAAFDPAQRESANLLAGTAGAMIGGSALARALKEENKREER
jgi:hypothetical protein